MTLYFIRVTFKKRRETQSNWWHNFIHVNGQHMHKNCNTCGVSAWKALMFACGSGCPKDCSLKDKVRWWGGRQKAMVVIHQAWLNVAFHSGPERWGSRSEVLQVGVLCVFLCRSAQWVQLSASLMCLHTNVKFALCSHCFLMEPIRIVKRRVPKKLTRTILQYLSRVSWNCVTQS